MECKQKLFHIIVSRKTLSAPIYPAMFSATILVLAIAWKNTLTSTRSRFYQDQLKNEEKPRRPLFYARTVQSQFALLAFFTEEEQEQQAGRQTARQFLLDTLGIEKLVSVYFILHEPPWTSKDGDARFWNARGVLGDFLAIFTMLP